MVDTNKNKILGANLLFYIAICTEIVIVIIDKSSFVNPLEGRLFQLTFVLCMLKIVMTKYNLKEWILIVLFLALGFVSDRITDRNEIIRFVAFIAASKGIDRNKTLKIVFYVTLVGILGLVILSLLGIFGDAYLLADYGRSEGLEKRYCLGLGHPNALHCMFWALLTLGIYLYSGKLKWWNYVILMVINIGLFVLTDSRTGLLVSGFCILCGAIYSLCPSIKDKRWIYIIGGILLIAFVAFSIDAATYNGYFDADARPLMAWINSKMTGRIFEGGITGAIEKWSLFSDAEVKGYTDMGYIKLFHWYGIIPACIYILSILSLIKFCYKKRDISALLLISSFSIYTLVEAHAVSPYFGRNYLIMLFIGVWSEVFLAQKGVTGYFWQLKKIFKGINTHEESVNV